MTPFFDVRGRGFRDRTEIRDVMALLDQRLSILESESISLSDAAGRVLADPVVSSVNVPGFPRAAMDGFAVRAADTFGADPDNPMALTQLGECRPGTVFPGEVKPGSAVRVMTGAPLPAGADAVLMAEFADVRDGQVSVKDAVSPGKNVGRVGEDVSAGAVILPAGRVLRPQDLGLLAAVGAGTVRVVRRPRVAILVTGNELLPPGSTPTGVRIVDSNSPMLAALVARDGGVCEPVVYLRDDYETVKAAIRDTTADVVLVSGGSSVGSEDHAPRALSELGELAVHGVALRPASPTGLGFLRVLSPSPLGGEGLGVRGGIRNDSDVLVVLLPGNPVSCLCAYDLFAGRVVRTLGGRNPDLPYRSETYPVASKIVSALGRVDYVRVKVVEGKVEPIAVSGAAILSTTVAADGFVLVPGDCEGYGPGDRVEVYRYDG